MSQTKMLFESRNEVKTQEMADVPEDVKTVSDDS
jgi:hypothetical protein